VPQKNQYPTVERYDFAEQTSETKPKFAEDHSKSENKELVI
jgi:hypothetical protein